MHLYTYGMFVYAAALLLSRPAAAQPHEILPNDHCVNPSLSDGGRWITFDSAATNLTAGEQSLFINVYLYNAADRRIIPLSTTGEGRLGSGPSLLSSITADGRYVVFQTAAPDIAPHPAPAPPPSRDIYQIVLLDRADGSMRRLPVAGPGVEPNGDCRSPRITPDGRWVVFDSIASNLVPDDTNNAYDVFIHEIATGRTERVSLSAEGRQCRLGGHSGQISNDGRLVAFASLSEDVVPGDANGLPDIFLHDREARSTILVSRTPTGEFSSGASGKPALSGDGSAIAFESTADLTRQGSTPGLSIFRFDVATGSVLLISRDHDGRPGDGGSHTPAISTDGSTIAYASIADNLARRPVHQRLQIILAAAPDWLPSPVTNAPDGAPADRDSGDVAFATCGRILGFSSTATNLVALPIGRAAIIVHDIDAGSLRAVSHMSP